MRLINIIIALLVLTSTVYALGVEINPVNPNTDDNLICNYNGFTSGFIFNWFINGVYEKSGNPLESFRTGVGDNISCDAWMVMPGQDVPLGTVTTIIVNRDPVVSNIPDININEDSIYTFDLSSYVTDLDNDPITWSVSGNTNINVNIVGSIVTITPNADWNGVENLLFTARDPSNAADSDNVVVTVNPVNDAPVITSFNPVNSPVNVNEGSSQLFSIVANDVDGDPLTYDWRLDGVQVSTAASYNFNSVDGPDAHILTVTVSDGSLVAQNTWNINEINVNPTVAVVNNGPISEGQAITVSVGVTDPGVLDTFTYSFDWDNDGIYDIVDQVSNSASFTFVDSGVYTVGVRVRDDDTGLGYGITNVVVNNVLPVADADGPYACQLGNSINVIGSNLGYAGDSVAYSWDLDNDSAYDDSVLQNPIYNCASLGVFTIGLRIVDDEGGVSTDTSTVTVTVLPVNNPPVVTITNPANGSTYVVGSNIIFTGTAVDPEDGVISNLIQWSSSIDGALGIGASININTLSLGTHIITAIVTDSGGLQDTDNVNVIIVTGATQCSDSVDNDGDGLIDLLDPGCVDSFDNDETNVGVTQCSDSIDNDGDSLIDYPSDPGCVAAGDNDETNVGVTQCSNGIDDDGDGLIDLLDPGCIDVNDNDETNVGVTQCSDSVDNDGDGFIDLLDSGCIAAGDTSEQENPVASFTASSTNINELQSVSFNASGSSDVDGNIVSYLWDFGDSTTGSGVFVNHIYNNAGIYNVTLTVTDNDGLTDTDSIMITVNNVIPSVSGSSGSVGEVKHDFGVKNLKLVKGSDRLFVIFDLFNNGNVKEDLNVEIIVRDLSLVNSLGSYSLAKDSERMITGEVVLDLNKDYNIEVRVYNNKGDVSESIGYGVSNIYKDEAKYVGLNNISSKIKEESILSLIIWGLLVLLMLVLVILGFDYALR